MKVFKNLSEMGENVGKELGVTEWQTITQEQINDFAEATGDLQWIHTKPLKAKFGPFGTTIAHGFLTISLLSAMYYDAIPQTEGLKMGINIGFDKLRFLAPVKCDDNMRGVFMLSNIAEKNPKTVTLTWATKVEIEGNSKPALLASWIEQQYL